VDISVSPVLLQSSSFEITSGQWMFRIRRKQMSSREYAKLFIRSKLAVSIRWIHFLHGAVVTASGLVW
jgi:hypothetical protein